VIQTKRGGQLESEVTISSLPYSMEKPIIKEAFRILKGSEDTSRKGKEKVKKNREGHTQ